MNLIDILKKHENSVRLHMPGHKGINLSHLNNDIFNLDLTELADTDNLHDAKDILKDIQEKTAQIYNCRQSRFLVNGTTAGVLASINTSFKPGDKILVQRNSHMSVYHAAMLTDINLVYAYNNSPRCNEAYALDLSELEKHADGIKGIVLTYPTFVGTCADIAKISSFAKANNITLIVDEAHGAHMRFSEKYPLSAEECGVDLAVQSTHKTLSSLTQTSLLHVCSDKTDVDRLDFYLRVYQTSSPSYILMNSLYDAVMYASENAGTVFNNIITWRDELKEMLAGTDFYLMEEDVYDWSKIWVNVKQSGYSGFEIKKMLDEKNVYVEYASFDYVLGLGGIGTSRSDFIALANALKSIKSRDAKQENKIVLPKAQAKTTLKEALLHEYVYCDYKDTKNKTAADFIIPYPPGIPLIVPGEIINQNIIDLIARYENTDMDVMGLKNGKIKVLK